MKYTTANQALGLGGILNTLSWAYLKYCQVIWQIDYQSVAVTGDKYRYCIFGWVQGAIQNIWKICRCELQTGSGEFG